MTFLAVKHKSKESRKISELSLTELSPSPDEVDSSTRITD